MDPCIKVNPNFLKEFISQNETRYTPLKDEIISIKKRGELESIFNNIINVVNSMGGEASKFEHYFSHHYKNSGTDSYLISRFFEEIGSSSSENGSDETLQESVF